MLIERATPQDIPELHALIESAYRGESARRGWTHEADLLGGQRTDAAALDAIVRSPNQLLLIHSAAGSIDACVAITSKPDRLVYIGMVTVKPERQGSGLGKDMLAAAEQHAVTEFGASQAEMTVIARRHELVAWYERRGYCRTGERRPFPMHDPRFGEPKVSGLEFVVLEKALVPVTDVST